MDFLSYNWKAMFFILSFLISFSVISYWENQDGNPRKNWDLELWCLIIIISLFGFVYIPYTLLEQLIFFKKAPKKSQLGRDDG